MNRKSRRAAESRPRSAHNTALAQIVASLERGDATGAAAAAQSAIAADPRSAEAYRLLGNARLLEARLEDAAACYRHAIALAPASAEALFSLGLVLDRQGQFESAADAFQAAVAARGAYLEAHCGLAGVLAKLDRREDAIAAYRRALAIQPRFPGVLNNLSRLLLVLRRFSEAVDACRQAIAIDPKSPESHYNLGNALRDHGQHDEAAVAYRQAAVLRPDNPEAHIALGNILMARGETDDANALFRHAYRLRPLSKRAAVKQPPDFSVLLLVVPGSANTPSDYLVSGASYDSHLLAVMDGIDYDFARLRQCGDVVVNLISDVDWNRDVLARVSDLVEKLDRPVINHPLKILATGREEVAKRLSGIPGCRVPKTVRASGAALIADFSGGLGGFSFPVVARITGTHGGEAFEKLTESDAMIAFVTRVPDAEYYVSDYIPYESADGYFRKYRLIFVDGKTLPYHLAISDQWKVHHFSTDMTNQSWMRREEEVFVKEPHNVFGAAQWAVLETIRTAIGLDYFGIDCALDQSGNVVVFEVNATMLVHGETGTFAYKQPYIVRIKEAFDAMLVKSIQNARVDS